jgi:hypothetical protein
MTPEAKPLIACCRHFLKTDTSEDLAQSASDVNWGRALLLGESHAVIPIIYSALKQQTSSIIPEALNASFQAHVRTNLTLAAELLSLLSLLAAGGITAIPLKGPTLALQAYGDLSLRSFSDLDLLVSPSDVPRARQVLIANGYRMHWTLPSFSPSAYLKIKEQQLSFVQANGTVAVDLHWRLVPDYFSAEFGWNEAVNKAESVMFCGRPVLSLSTEDLLRFLCVHGGKHLWMRLGWICDLAGFIRSNPDINWKRTLAEAARLNAMRALSVGLLLVTELLRLVLPEEVVRAIRSDRVASRLARDIQDRLFSPTPVGHTSLEACRFHLRMTQGLGNKLRLFTTFVFTPGEAEFRVLQLPAWLYPLYYPFRIARLAAKYVSPKR